MSDERPIWLALSGGGFRAMLFHLGVIQQLDLRRVEKVFGVSGGAILAAHMVQHWAEYQARSTGGDWNSDGSPIIKLMELCGAGPRSWMVLRGTPDQGQPWGPGLRRLFGDTQMSSLVRGPQLRLICTGLHDNSYWALRPEGSVRLQLDTEDKTAVAGTDKGNLKVWEAVSASATFPFAFGPKSILDGDFVDGGVVDNTGAFMMSRELELAPEDTQIDVVVSDAGSGFVKSRPSFPRRLTGGAASLLMALDWLGRQHVDELKQVCETRGHGFSHILINPYDMRGDASETDALEHSQWNDLAATRTDLDVFDDVERERLVGLGGELARKQAAEHLTSSAKAPRVPPGLTPFHGDLAFTVFGTRVPVFLWRRPWLFGGLNMALLVAFLTASCAGLALGFDLDLGLLAATPPSPDAAGCLIVDERGRVLVVVEEQRPWLDRSSGRPVLNRGYFLSAVEDDAVLSLPGGWPESEDDGDLARTAARETEEEVGIKVTADEVVGTLNDNGVNFTLFRCNPEHHTTATAPLETPSNALGFGWVYLTEVPTDGWRFPRQTEQLVAKVAAQPEYGRAPTSDEGGPAQAAGCLVASAQGMLMVMHEKRGQVVFSPPAGGVESGETAAAAAVRETREETGMAVEAGQAIASVKEGRTEFTLFHCSSSGEEGAVPTDEVVTHVFVDPMRVPSSAWRFPEQAEIVRTAYLSVGRQERAPPGTAVAPRTWDHPRATNMGPP